MPPVLSGRSRTPGVPLERFPIRRHRLIEKEPLRFKELEHVLIEKVGQLFRNMLWGAPVRRDARSHACPSFDLQKQRDEFALAMCVGLGKDRFQLIARRLS
jgi:hypothetical protein